MTRDLLYGVAAAVMLTAIAPSAQARPGDRYTIEFAMLPTVVFMHESYLDSRRDYFEGESYNLTSTPIDVAQFRVTLWSRSAFIVDLAALVIRNRDSWESSRDNNRHLYEGGISYDFGIGESRFRPFAGGLAGLIRSNSPDLRGYLGAQAGTRFFVKDWAATRVQVVYRHTLARADEQFRAVELSGGIGFFL